MSLDSESEEVEMMMKSQTNEASTDETAALTFDETEESEQNVTKGDPVGDTAYSDKWIINTLISLSKVFESGWSEELESELCMLWDMTDEKDVVLFLMENEFLKMAEFTLKNMEEPRLTEIMLGIICNMCCQETVLETVGNKKELVGVILNLVSSEDPETLIQLLRLLRTAVWDLQKNHDSVWSSHFEEHKFVGSSLIFILKSSTNEDLLIAATDLLQSISMVELPGAPSLLADIFDIDALIPALLESFTQIIPKRDANHSESELKVIENWLTILSNIMRTGLLTFEQGEEDENFIKIMDVLLRILQPYVDQSNLVPLDERAALCIHECVAMILCFQRNEMHATPEIIYITITILFLLRRVIKTDPEYGCEMDPDDTMMELLVYLERYWIELLGICDGVQLLDVFQMCKNEVIKCLKDLVESHPRSSKDKIVKMAKAESFLQSM